MTTEAVANIQEFKKKWGTHLPVARLAIEDFIRRAPEFQGDENQAKIVGEFLADLQTSLEAL